MSTHNIGFYEHLTKIIFELSSSIIKFSAALKFAQTGLTEEKCLQRMEMERQIVQIMIRLLHVQRLQKITVT